MRPLRSALAVHRVCPLKKKENKGKDALPALNQLILSLFVWFATNIGMSLAENVKYYKSLFNQFKKHSLVATLEDFRGIPFHN